MLTKTYKELQERKYGKYSTCQLPSCNNRLEKLAYGVKKYCCKEHALKAQELYKNEWQARNKENVKLWNARYWKNITRKKKQGYENKAIDTHKLQKF